MILFSERICFMSILELFLTALSLSMDAFAVSVSNGLCVKAGRIKTALLCAAVFGGFQGIMPAAGYRLGISFCDLIERADHWIALLLLSFIGINMICGSFSEDKKEAAAQLTFFGIIVQGFATSVDALAVGVSFAALSVNIVRAAGFICIVTAMLSFIGFVVGRKFSAKLKNKAQLSGGVVLIMIGFKIFAEHTVFA